MIHVCIANTVSMHQYFDLSICISKWLQCLCRSLCEYHGLKLLSLVFGVKQYDGISIEMVT